MENQKRTNKPIKLTRKEGTKTRAEAIKRAKQKRMIRKLKRALKIGVAGLTVSSIAIGGYCVVDGYNFIKKVDKDIKSDREKWLEENNIRNEETLKTQELQQQTDIIEDILEQYNSSLPEEQQIDEEDIGIWEEQYLNDGQIYQNADGIYIRDYLTTLNEEENNIKWMEGEDVKALITVIDKENEKAITSMGIIDGEYAPVEVDAFTIDGKTPYTKAENYITLEGNAEENFKKLHQKVQERSQSKTNQQEQADDGSR